MYINQLIHFQAVAKYENITQAANELYITQSALSKSIRQLETELHTELFDRHGRTVSLNNAGNIVLKYANHIIETVNMMNKELDRLSDSSEHKLNIATNRPLIAHNLFPRISIDHPEIKFSSKLAFMTGSIASSFLESGVCDLLITDFSISSAEIISEFHSEEKLCMSVKKGSPLASLDIIRKKDFDGLTLPATEYSYETVLRPLKEGLEKDGINFKVKMVPDIASINYLLQISDIPAVFTDVAWAFNLQPDRVLVDIEWLPRRKNYISYLKKDEAKLRPQTEDKPGLGENS